MDDYYSENPFTGFFPDNIEKIEPWRQPKQTPQQPDSRTAAISPQIRSGNPGKMTISFGTGQGEPTIMVNGRPVSPNQVNSNSPFNFEFSTTNNKNPSDNRNETNFHRTFCTHWPRGNSFAKDTFLFTMLDVVNILLKNQQKNRLQQLRLPAERRQLDEQLGGRRAELQQLLLRQRHRRNSPLIGRYPANGQKLLSECVTALKKTIQWVSTIVALVMFLPVKFHARTGTISVNGISFTRVTIPMLI